MLVSFLERWLRIYCRTKETTLPNKKIPRNRPKSQLRSPLLCQLKQKKQTNRTRKTVNADYVSHSFAINQIDITQPITLGPIFQTSQNMELNPSLEASNSALLQNPMASPQLTTQFLCFWNLQLFSSRLYSPP